MPKNVDVDQYSAGKLLLHQLQGINISDLKGDPKRIAVLKSTLDHDLKLEIRQHKTSSIISNLIARMFFEINVKMTLDHDK